MDTYDFAAENNYFSDLSFSMGYQPMNYDLKGKNKETLRKDLATFDVIYVEGGNTYYLLNEVKKSGFDTVIKKLLKSGIVYIGSNAGSVIMCPTVDHARIIEHPELVPELTDYSGIGLVDKHIAPHYGNPKYTERYEQIKAEWGDKLTLLRDDQAVIVNGDKTKIVTV